MLKENRIESTVKPQTLFNLGTGYWQYNYDIQEKQVLVKDMEEEEEKLETRYTFIQVRLYGKPDYKRCVEAVIRTYITQSQEFDLINSANKVSLGLDISEEDLTKYKDYLNLVTEIKAKVKKDF